MSLLKFTPEFTEAVNRWDGRVGAPHPENRKKNGISVYENPFVEKYFARAHPLLPGVWTIPLIGFALYKGWTTSGLRPVMVLAFFGLGVLVWSLFEYLLHRFIFHMRPSDDFNSKARMFMFHGYHHEFPNDKHRLVAPLIMSLPLGAMFGVIYFFLAGNAWLPMLAGTALGYLSYDWIHYYTHHFRPKKGIGKYLRRFHMVHHYKDWDRNHGISSPLWDLFFFSRHTKKHDAKAGAAEEEMQD